MHHPELLPIRRGCFDWDEVDEPAEGHQFRGDEKPLDGDHQQHQKNTAEDELILAAPEEHHEEKQRPEA